MSLIVFGPKVFERHVSVFLGSCEARVSKKLLDGPQISPTLQQMGCETMTQRVRGQTAAGRQTQASLFDQTLNITSIEAAATNTDEYGRLPIIFRTGEAETISFRKIGR